MKLTTKGNYAIAALLDLNIHSGNKHISLKEIATRLDISENYLRQLFMELKHNGLVDSVRGVGGGYFLSKQAKDIRILDVVEAVEGKIYVVPCLEDECESACQRYDECSARSVWDSLNMSVIKGLEKLTLQVLTDEYNKE